MSNVHPSTCMRGWTRVHEGLTGVSATCPCCGHAAVQFEQDPSEQRRGRWPPPLSPTAVEAALLAKQEPVPARLLGGPVRCYTAVRTIKCGLPCPRRHAQRDADLAVHPAGPAWRRGRVESMAVPVILVIGPFRLTHGRRPSACVAPLRRVARLPRAWVDGYRLGQTPRKSGVEPQQAARDALGCGKRLFAPSRQDEGPPVATRGSPLKVRQGAIGGLAQCPLWYTIT